MKQTRQYNYLIQVLSKTFEQLQLDLSPFLSAAGINLDCLGKDLKVITRQQQKALLFEIIQKVPIPGLGLKIGCNMDLNDQGAAGYLAMTCQTVKEAIYINLKYRSLVTNILETEIKITDSELSWRYKSDSPLEKMHRLTIEWAMAAHHTAVRQSTGQDIYPLELKLNFPEPEYSQQYQELFQCPVTFDQPHCEIHYSVSLLDEPLPAYDPTVKAAMEELCDGLIRKISDQRDVIGDVKELIREKRGFFPSLEYISDRLNVSSRTLHRRLKDKDTTFQSLLDEARQELAQQYLAETELQIQQIAELCGFREAQNFSIAFKRWTGTPPSEYRNQHQLDSRA